MATKLNFLNCQTDLKIPTKNLTTRVYLNSTNIIIWGDHCQSCIYNPAITVFHLFVSFFLSISHILLHPQISTNKLLTLELVHWGAHPFPLQLKVLPTMDSTSVTSLSRVETLKKLDKLMGAQAKGIRYFPKRWQKDSAWSFSFSIFSLLWRKMGRDKQKNDMAPDQVSCLAMDMTGISKLPTLLIKKNE